MIDIALKHFIYEVCIDVAFDGIRNNFATTSKYKVGDKFYSMYSYIKLGYGAERYLSFYHVEIEYLTETSLGIAYQASRLKTNREQPHHSSHYSHKDKEWFWYTFNYGPGARRSSQLLPIKFIQHEITYD